MVSGFWIGLLARAAVSAFVVVAATVAAEAAGPFWGGLIVSLPIGAGPAYVMLALQHDAGFIAASALGSFAVNAATFVFLAVLALLAVRVRWGWALAGSLGAWARGGAADPAGRVGPGRREPAQSGRRAGVPGGDPLGGARGGRRGRAVRRRWFELPVRAAMVGLMVGGVVTGSRALGPAADRHGGGVPGGVHQFRAAGAAAGGRRGGGGDHGERSCGRCRGLRWRC